MTIKGRAYTPKAGYAWNPLRDFPRNEVCFCGSGKKFKKCHADRLRPCVSLKGFRELTRFFALRAAGRPVKLTLIGRYFNLYSNQPMPRRASSNICCLASSR